MLEGRADEVREDFSEDGVEVRALGFDLGSAHSLKEALVALLSTVTEDGYISIHAYLDRTAFGSAQELRELVAKRSGRPTTFGWAPRFLHSTGQYHKGGPAQGVYLQIVSRASNDLAVPGRDFTLGELIASQAAGDAAVLAEHGRPVLTLTVSDVSTGLELISRSI
jgi:glucose-6-phosphate isomerase